MSRKRQPRLRRHVIAKLVAPRATQIVRRGRVLSAIAQQLRAGACWVAAPAGYGKTIAITDYLTKTGTPFVWYRVIAGGGLMVAILSGFKG